MPGTSKSSKARAKTSSKSGAKDAGITKASKKAPKKGKDRKTYKFYKSHLDGLELLWHLGDLRYNPHTGDFNVTNEDSMTARAYGMQCGASGQSNPAQKWRQLARMNCPPELLAKSAVPADNVHLPEYGIYPIGHDLHGMSRELLEDSKRPQADRVSPLPPDYLPRHQEEYIAQELQNVQGGAEVQNHPSFDSQGVDAPFNAGYPSGAESSQHAKDRFNAPTTESMNIGVVEAQTVNQPEMISSNTAPGTANTYQDGYGGREAASFVTSMSPTNAGFDPTYNTFIPMTENNNNLMSFDDTDISPFINDNGVNPPNFTPLFPTPSIPTPSRSAIDISRPENATPSNGHRSSLSYTTGDGMNGFNNTPETPLYSNMWDFDHNLPISSNIYDPANPLQLHDNEASFNDFYGFDTAGFQFGQPTSDDNDFEVSAFSFPAGQGQ